MSPHAPLLADGVVPNQSDTPVSEQIDILSWSASRCVRSPATAPCISEAEITAEWVSVGSSEQCGDPGEVTVTVQP